MDDKRYEVKDPKIQGIMKYITGNIKSIIPEDWGFTIFLFSFKAPIIFYMSNARKEDMIKTIQEWLDKQKKEEKV